MSARTRSARSSPAKRRRSSKPSGRRRRWAAEGWVRFFALQGQGDPDTVVTFGFFDGTRDDGGPQADHGYAERRRKAEEQFVDR